MSTNNIDVNELIQMSASARQEKEKSRNEKYEEAYRIAIEKIIDGVEDKMKQSASRGYEKSIIYQFQYNPDPTAEVDPSGTLIKFNGIWLLDMLIKGNRRFIQLLNEHFNKGLDEPKFSCYFQKKDTDNTYRIFVSWHKRVQKEYSDSNHETTSRKPKAPVRGRKTERSASSKKPTSEAPASTLTKETLEEIEISQH
jgi:hypothetical protein